MNETQHRTLHMLTVSLELEQPQCADAMARIRLAIPAPEKYSPTVAQMTALARYQHDQMRQDDRPRYRGEQQAPANLLDQFFGYSSPWR